MVHDCYLFYFNIGCAPAICGAHILRELRFVEESGQRWAALFAARLRAACHASNQGEGSMEEGLLASFQRRAWRALKQGMRLNLAATERREGASKGVIKQTKAWPLIERFNEHWEPLLRFDTAPGAPFANNVAGRAMRMPKVKIKLKVSGVFRTEQGQRDYCALRSLFDTIAKQGHRPFGSLVNALQGNPTPPLSA